MRDTLGQMLNDQQNLQEKSYGYNFAMMTDEDRVRFITWNILALEDELHEALNEIGWKPWTASNHVNENALRGELIDAFHFLMNLFIVSGMNHVDVFDAYQAKRIVNAKRQLDGYDGLSTKCRHCSRALDDPAVSCTSEQCGVVGVLF